MYGRDITDKKKAEEKLKESERNLKEAQKLGKIGSWEFEFLSGKIIWSDETYALYERDKALGPPSVDEEGQYYSPEEAKKLHDLANLAIKTGKEFKYDIVARLPSGKTANFVTSMRPIMGDGKIIKLFGTIQDITERKKDEEKLKEDEKRLRESLATSARQNIQLHRILQEKTKMREKIDRYAKQLETKLKIAENNKIPLTKKEKIVLFGICNWPLLNDEGLSKKLKINRSTVTAIRNRLRKEKWYDFSYLPNFHALGYESLSAIFCNFNTLFSERKNLGIIKEIEECPEIIFSRETETSAFYLFISKKFIQLKGFFENSLLAKQNILKNEPTILSFFFEINTVWNGFGPFFNNFFGLNLNSAKEQMFKGGISLNDLNKNERRVLLALVENPHLSITQISKKIWLSKPTVGKIKSRLLEKEYITPFVIPDLEKMMLGQYCVSFEFDRQSLQKLQLFEMKNKDDISIVKIFGGKEILFIIVAKNEDELEGEIQRIKSSYNKSGFYPTFSVLNFSSSKKLLSIKKDFVSIIKPILFPEEF